MSEACYDDPIANDASTTREATRPVIFLDIDGVLNRSNQNGGGNRHVVSTDLVNAFRSLISSTNARVVLASTWRHQAGGLQKARELGILFDDVLPDLRPQSRGAEVRAWMARHPCVDRFAILDDDDDGYDEMPLFQPDPHSGVTSEVLNAVKDYLSGRRRRDLRRSLLTRGWQHLKTLLEGHRG